QVPTTLRLWPNQPGPAVAGVSSFGFGGTNCHVVVQEFRPQDWQAFGPQMGQPSADSRGIALNEADRGPLLVPLSAKSEQALRDVARQTIAWVRAPDHRPTDLAYTTGVRRSHHEHRLAIVASSVGELLTSLEAASRGEDSVHAVTGRVASRVGKLAF